MAAVAQGAVGNELVTTRQTPAADLLRDFASLIRHLRRQFRRLSILSGAPLSYHGLRLPLGARTSLRSFWMVVTS